MPAVPVEWKDIAFEKLRAEGAFLVSVKKTGGQIEEVKIVSEKGGSTKLKLPFKTWFAANKKGVSISNANEGFISLTFKPGATLVLKNGYE
jgi:alpha-L-fucosidase 2